MLIPLPTPAAPQETGTPNAWNAAACRALIDDLTRLRRTLCDHAVQLAPWTDRASEEHKSSAINLAHYLALRRVDLRSVQERLAVIGLSSLGRAESHVLANLDKVLGLLHLLAGRPWQAPQHEEPTGFHSGPRALRRNAERLFGSAPARRDVRIMVTLPSEAATDAALADRLVAAGMDVARINCAHDDAAVWRAMTAQVRRAAKVAGRTVHVHADLAGPKLRTGDLPPGPAVLRVKPQRDALGRIVAPARFALRPAGSQARPTDGTPVLDVDPAWFERLRKGDVLHVTDTRNAERRFRLRQPRRGLALAEGPRKAYLGPQTLLHLAGHGEGCVDTRIGGIAPSPGAIRLHRGDRLQLLPPGGEAAADTGPPSVACTLAAALVALKVGDPVWFDDGRIGGVARRRLAHGGVEVEITHARDGGETLRADKGINLPDTALDLPALTPKDHEDLVAVAPWVDSVGLSFTQSAEDVRSLRAALARCGVPERGIVLKVETVRGFAHLPELLFAALEGPSAGIMIARGDLAVECGFERLAEVQEEMLWACEAAHLPVVWATQVLETQARTGLPSRAEVTDAAMGERAECVMLNKGPHIVDAMYTLDGILRRMQGHQSKKRQLMRSLKAWDALSDAPRRKGQRAA